MNFKNKIGLVLMLASAYSYASEERVMTKSYDSSSVDRVSISNINGDVSFTSWEQDSIEITATLKASSERCLEKMTVEFNDFGSTASAKTEYEKNDNNRRNNCRSSVTYKVSMPNSVEISDTELVNGNLTISGIWSPIDAKLVNGDANVSGVKSNVTLRSVNGEVTVDYDESSVDVKEINLKTVNGSLNLNVSESSNLYVSAKTISGHLSNDFNIPVDKSGVVGQKMTGSIGNGEGRAKLSSVNGRISINSK